MLGGDKIPVVVAGYAASSGQSWRDAESSADNVEPVVRVALVAHSLVHIFVTFGMPTITTESMPLAEPCWKEADPWQDRVVPQTVWLHRHDMVAANKTQILKGLVLRGCRAAPLTK